MAEMQPIPTTAIITSTTAKGGQSNLLSAPEVIRYFCRYRKDRIDKQNLIPRKENILELYQNLL